MPVMTSSSNHWKIFLIIFLAILTTFGVVQVNHISNYIVENRTNIVGNVEDLSLTVGSHIGTFLTHSYNLIYYKVIGIPVVFWFLIAINLFLIYVLKLENVKAISYNILASYTINKDYRISQKYRNFRDFICSSYGAVSIASISEIVILVQNYNTIGSIFWMCITILLIGLIQLCEIIINCHYVENTDDTKSSFVCVLQYVGKKYSALCESEKTAKRIGIGIGIFGVTMVLVSFFSAALFQIEQVANFFIHSGGDYESAPKTIGIGLVFLFLIVSLNHFRVALKINNKIVTPMILIYLLISFFFLMLNSTHTLNTLTLIFEDLWNPESILPGIVSGLVISFARYVYKKYNNENATEDDEDSVYEDTDLIKATVMYTVESFFMMFLVIVAGVCCFIYSNFDYQFFGLNFQYINSLFLVFFAISVIFNEAIYSKIVLYHIVTYKDVVSDWILRIVLLFGVFMGVFPQTDNWVDIADHVSIIFLLINLSSFFLLRRDTKNMFDSYRTVLWR